MYMSVPMPLSQDISNSFQFPLRYLMLTVHDRSMFWNIIKQVHSMLCQDRKVLQSMITAQRCKCNGKMKKSIHVSMLGHKKVLSGTNFLVVVVVVLLLRKNPRNNVSRWWNKLLFSKQKDKSSGRKQVT